MNIDKNTYEQIILNIDNINKEDPNLDGSSPKELLYSNRMLETLLKFNSQAEDDLKIACYGQHIKRWAFPRSSFPEGKAGYLKWRKELYTIHADLVTDTIRKSSASQEFTNSVRDIMVNKVSGKENSQTLEDVACLVFLEHYLEDFVTKHTEEKLILIIKKTWNKMSEVAHESALKLPFTEDQLVLINKAIG